MQRPRLISLLLAAFLILTCMLFVSCFLDLEDADVPAQTPAGEDSGTSGGGGETPSADNTYSRSLSDLEPGESIVVEGVDADTEITLSDFTLEDGIFIEIISDSGRDLSVDRAISSNMFFERQDGTLIPIPNEHQIALFTGKLLGIISKCKIIISKLDRLDLDLEIDSLEDKYDGKNGMAEEYYYVIPELMGLDPSEIVVVETGSGGARNYSVLHSAMMGKSELGLFDFSHSLIPGFAIDMNMKIGTQEHGLSRLHILNPIHVSSTPTELTRKDVNILMVPAQAGGEYKVVITFDGLNAATIIREILGTQLTLEIKPRTKDGENRENNIYPEFNPDEGTITYHLGEVEEDMLFTLNYTMIEDLESVGISVVLSEDNEGITVHDISSFDGTIEIDSIPNKVFTWAFESSTIHPVRAIKYLPDNTCRMRMYFIGNNRGGGLGRVRNLLFSPGGTFNLDGNEKFTGYIVFDCTDLDDEIRILTLEETQLSGIGCPAVAWDQGSKKYVCCDESCTLCPDEDGKRLHYSLEYLNNNRDVIFSNMYVAEGSYGEYGQIAFGNGAHIQTMKPNMTYGPGGTTGDEKGRWEAYCTEADDVTKMITVIIDKILVSENKLVCDIIINKSIDEKDVYENVEMTLGHVHHAWEFDEESSTVHCSIPGCEEQRNAIKLDVNADPVNPYVINTNKDVIISLPITGDYFFCNGTFEAGILEVNTFAYVIAMDPDCSVSQVSRIGNTFTFNVH